MPKGTSQTKSVPFVQTPGDGEYVGAIEQPVGSFITDFGIVNRVAWDCDSAAVEIKVDGFSYDLLNNVDLAVDYQPGGEAFPLQRVGSIWSPVARNIIAKITQVGGGAGGEALFFVTYVVPVEGAAALKA